MFAALGSGAGCERETDFAPLRDGARSLRTAVEKHSGAGRERETDFAALLNGDRPLRSTVEKRSGMALSVGNIPQSLRSAIEKRPEPGLIIEIGESHSRELPDDSGHQPIPWRNRYDGQRAPLTGLLLAAAGAARAWLLDNELSISSAA